MSDNRRTHNAFLRGEGRGGNRDPSRGNLTPRYRSYSSSNLGSSEGDTFWSAARQILEQMWLALKPGAYAFFVVKSFVRDKAIVEFPRQWMELCQSVGFEPVEWIRAWLTEDRGNARALFDFTAGEREVTAGETVQEVGREGVKDAILKRASFFRLLAEKKGSPRIDYEVVLVMRKGGA